MTTLVVSPHLDDAVLSLPGALQVWRDGGERLVVVTVFTEGGATHPARRQEDRNALEMLGAEALHLGFLDAPWRRGIPQTFRSLVLSPLAADDPDIAAVTKELKALATRVNPDRIVLPLGVGSHLDHRIVHATHRGLSGRIGFYEDRPYSLVRHAVTARLRALGAASAEAGSDPRRVEELVASALETPHVASHLRGHDEAAQIAALRELAQPLVAPPGPPALRLSLEPIAVDPEALVLGAKAIGAYRSQLADLFGAIDPLATLAANPVERIHWRL